MTRKCSNCGAYLIEGDFTCQVCGAKQDISNFKTKKDQPPGHVTLRLDLRAYLTFSDPKQKSGIQKN